MVKNTQFCSGSLDLGWWQTIDLCRFGFGMIFALGVVSYIFKDYDMTPDLAEHRYKACTSVRSPFRGRTQTGYDQVTGSCQDLFGLGHLIHQRDGEENA
ncbi:hypothetical protein D6I95_09135 [Alcaligenes faecalis]|nr:hypothetical protein D6I95_09135 [Alcaligenes faecalis]